MKQKTFFTVLFIFTTNSDIDTKNYESANEILWYDHTNEISSVVLHGTGPFVL